jgi:hypothetical protein
LPYHHPVFPSTANSQNFLTKKKLAGDLGLEPL